MIKTHQRITADFFQNLRHRQAEIILNVKTRRNKASNSFHLFACVFKVWKKGIIFNNRQSCNSSQQNPWGTSDYTSNPGWEQIQTSLYFHWGSWRLENPNMQQGRGFCCRKPLMQLWETSSAGIILLQFGSWSRSLHYILWRLQSDRRLDKRRPWGYFAMSVPLQYCFQSCLQMNQMRMSTPCDAQTVSLNHLPVQTHSLHFRTVSIVNALLGCYMQWFTHIGCDNKVLYNLFFYWVHSLLWPMLQKAKKFCAAAILSIFPLHLSIEEEKTWPEPRLCKSSNTFPCDCSAGVGEGICRRMRMGHWCPHARAHDTQGLRRCTATYGQTV